jgi:two-component system, LytTR family, response regulator
MTLRALVVDDEPIARRRLRTLLDAEPGVEIVAECEDGGAALDAVRRLQPDVMFLDVQMPGLDGFDVIELLKPDACPAVVFITAFDQYAMRAFEVSAADYLLKPFERGRLATAIARAAALGGTVNARRLRALMDTVRAGRPLRRFLVKTPGGAYAVRVEDVEAIESADHYVELRTAGRAHLIREPLSAIERRLDPSRFVRIHRSAIVNVDRIAGLRTGLHGEFAVVLASGRRLRCSRTYAATLLRCLKQKDSA